MTISLSSVKYVGPAMQTRLESHGINTVEQLAAMSQQALADIPGIGASTAQGILESANSLLTPALTTSTDSTVASEAKTEAASDSAEHAEAQDTPTTEAASTASVETAKPKAPAAKHPSRARTPAANKASPAAAAKTPATGAEAKPATATRSRAKKAHGVSLRYNFIYTIFTNPHT